MKGWQDYFNYENQMISDATPAFLLLILMSLVPVDLRQFKDDRKTNHRFRQKKFEFLLNWNNVIRRLPWNVILLFGGGLALAESTQVNVCFFLKEKDSFVYSCPNYLFVDQKQEIRPIRSIYSMFS